MKTSSHSASIDVPPPSASPPDARETSPSEHVSPDDWGWFESSFAKLAAGLLFGVIFGFLLQKGGVAKFDILVGVLLLENFVVVKVMLSAIIVGMIGSYLLRRTGTIEMQINETKYGANIVGGLIFGVGFGILAYCPGTNAAAIGQGNWDALVGLVGLLLGSYAYALSSKYSKGTVSRWGQCGKLTLPEVAGISAGAFIAIAAPALIGILVLLEFLGY